MAQDMKYSSSGRMKISAGYKPGNMAAFMYGSTKRKRKNRVRINEGYTLEDFKRVIDVKVSQWGKEPRSGEKDMRVYLRPSTLFGTKFEGYLQEKPAGANAVSVRNNNNFDRRNYDMDDLERRLLT